MTRMKESGIDWIGQIPEEWRVRPIKHIVETPVTDGPHETPVLYETGIPFLSAEAVKDGVLDFNFKRGYISLKDHDRFKKKISPKKDDIFIVKSGATTGNVGIVNTDEIFDIWSPLALIRCNKTLAIQKYIYFYLLSTLFKSQVEFNWSFGTQQNIGMGVIERIKVILPPVSEQQKIVEVLDKKTAQLDKAKALLEEQIQKLKDYRASLIYETVTKGLDKTVPMKDSGIDWIGQVPQGWGVSKLKFILEKGSNSIKVGPFGSSLSGDAIRSSGKWVYNQRNVLDNNFTETDFYISEAKCKELKNFSVSSGDILLTTRGTIGRVAIVPKKYCEGIIHPCLMKFKVDSRIVLPELIKYLFNDIPLVREQLNFLSNSTTIDVIYSYNLKNIIIPTIPIEEQYSILEVLDRQTSDVDALIKIKQKQIENINKQRQTLIYDYVTGKRRV